jgi:hypothetical protein
MVSKTLALVGILIFSIVGLSNFDFALGQTDTDVLILNPFPSSAQVDDVITFSGTLSLDNKNSEKPIVYIKTVNPTGEDSLLIMAHVNSDGTFSARWTVKEIDDKNNLKIYAFYEGERKLSKLTTCYEDQTNVWSSICPYSRSFTITDDPAPMSSIQYDNVGDEYIKFYYAFDFPKRPIVVIVPSPTSFDKVKSHIIPVQEGLLMFENQMTEKYGGNWKIKFEVIEPGDNYSSIEPDVIMNIVTEYEDEGCFDSYGGWADLTGQKPVTVHICSYNFGEKRHNIDVSATAAHEFIHAIGVGHTFGISGDMMCSMEDGVATCPEPLTSQSRVPTPLNLAAVAELYGTDGFKGLNNVVEFESKFSGNLNWNSDTTNFTYDRDRDGIYDFDDSCPSVAETYNRYLDWDGCPDGEETIIISDTDHDGIANEFDRCPTAAEIYNKFQDEDGCPDYIKPSEKPKKESIEPEKSETIEIPDWIRTETKWWAVGSISDTQFTTKGVVYLIDNELLYLESPIPDGKSIYFGGNAPNKFKINAEAWADGEMTNTEFLEKIQFLIDFGFLRIR